eukprot:TRINITY_DN104_c0_g1_i9.p1 TRINITY_DN104_c0_g1~~TRINITY_DN104_c0_g1_i9.p1  ORF type:complete len:373 (-),score=74.33 TRINITY_DN104_c0_g1_i9:474-1592(-)
MGGAGERGDAGENRHPLFSPWLRPSGEIDGSGGAANPRCGCAHHCRARCSPLPRTDPPLPSLTDRCRHARGRRGRCGRRTPSWSHGVRQPATSETYATVPLSTPADVPPARAALAAAQAAWADTPVKDRAAVISAFLDGFVERGEEVAAAISAATGKPAYGAMDELLITAAGGRHIAAGAPEWLADDTSRTCALVAGRTAVVRRVPHGVVTILSPYNFPLWLALGNVLAALLAGNAVMLKVSEAVPGIGLLIEELLAELAGGQLAPLVTVFHGASDVGAALVDAAVGKPDHVLFIGSVGVGRKVAIAAAAGGWGAHWSSVARTRPSCVRTQTCRPLQRPFRTAWRTMQGSVVLVLNGCMWSTACMMTLSQPL